jgi:hypothetical protein
LEPNVVISEPLIGLLKLSILILELCIAWLARGWPGWSNPAGTLVFD